MDGDVPLLLYQWYNIDLCSRCVFDLFFNCPRRRYNDSESVEPNRVFAVIVAVLLLFSSTILGIRNIVLFAKSAERSRKLLNFILDTTTSIRNTRNQQVLMLASAQEAYKAEKSYMRIKLMFGILDLVLSAGLILILIASILAATSAVYLGGLLSCLTIVGLSLIGLVSFLYLPLLVLENRARKQSAADIEKSLCFYLLAKQSSENIANFRLSPSVFAFTPSPTEPPRSSPSQTFVFVDQESPTPSAPPYEEPPIKTTMPKDFSNFPPPPSYEDLEKSGAFSERN